MSQPVLVRAKVRHHDGRVAISKWVTLPEAPHKGDSVVVDGQSVGVHQRSWDSDGRLTVSYELPYWGDWNAIEASDEWTLEH